MCARPRTATPGPGHSSEWTASSALGRRAIFRDLAHDVLMPEEPSELLRAVADLINANQRMRVNLDSNVMVLKQALLRLQEGVRIDDTLHLLPSKSQRLAAEDLLATLVSARRVLGEALVAAALDSGITVEELAQRLEESPEDVRAIAGLAARSAPTVSRPGP